MNYIHAIRKYSTLKIYSEINSNLISDDTHTLFADFTHSFSHPLQKNLLLPNRIERKHSPAYSLQVCVYNKRSLADLFCHSGSFLQTNFLLFTFPLHLNTYISRRTHTHMIYFRAYFHSRIHSRAESLHNFHARFAALFRFIPWLSPFSRRKGDFFSAGVNRKKNYFHFSPTYICTRA